LAIGRGEARAQQRNWALVIGTGTYEDTELNLPCIEKDVDELAKVLTQRGDYAPDRVVTLRDPSREEFKKVIADFLNGPDDAAPDRPEKGDQVLVYFSGHGFHAEDGGLYLAPADFQRDKPAESGIRVDWLREQVADCPATSKILIVDSCFSGSEENAFSGREDNAAAASEIEKAFDGLDGVVTLASSTKDEESLIWKDMGQSLFSYWLTQGLAGHADTSMDGAITLDEIYNFVHAKVTQTAALGFGCDQTPVASMRFSSRGFPTISRIRPQSLDAVLADMAQQIVWAVEGQRLKRIVSVPPFLFTSYRDINALDVERREVGGGSLGLTCAERFHIALDAVDSAIKIQTRDEARRILKAVHARPEDLGTFGGMQRIAKGFLDPTFPPVVVYGELLEREPGVVQIRARAIRNDTKATLIETGGTAELSLEDWMETGKSVVVEAEDFERDLDPKTGHYKTRGVDVIEEQVDSSGELEAHPMSDPSFPYRLKIMVRDGSKRGGWVERRCHFVGNNAYVALEKGDEYRIRIAYRGPENAFVKLMVDGLNIKSQEALPEATEEELKTRGVEVLSLNPVSLEHTDKKLAWVLKPGEVANPEWEFEGFYLSRDLVCPFLVGERGESPGLADQIGLITAVFYEELGAERGELGTTTSEPRIAERRVVQTTAGNIGNPIASVHIHYVSSEELRRLTGD
jgi:hypothetical protein